MVRINEAWTVYRKILPVIFVINTSGAMTGGRIASVNEAMREAIEILREPSDSCPSAEVRVGILRFSTEAEWMTRDGLESLDDYHWSDLSTGGLKNLGLALYELNQKLSRRSFFENPIGYRVPIIILITTGLPTDNWENALVTLKTENKWFAASTKIAIAIDADEPILFEVVGSQDAVLSAESPDEVERLITTIATTISSTGLYRNDSIVNDIRAKLGLEQCITDTPSFNNDGAENIPSLWVDNGLGDDDIWGKKWKQR